MDPKLKIIEPLWDKYREQHIKIDANSEDVKSIAKIFYAGALMMLTEYIEIQKDVWREMLSEFKEFDKEITDEQQK